MRKEGIGGRRRIDHYRRFRSALISGGGFSTPTGAKWICAETERRCAARFAYIKGIAKEKMSFETGAGIIDAEVRGDEVKLRLTEPQAMKTNISVMLEERPLEVSFINTGVPHVVLFVHGLDRYDVFNIGRKIRYHKEFQPEGTNANFMEVIDRHTIRIRTYERGVEDETLACGTGAVASALISSSQGTGGIAG